MKNLENSRILLQLDYGQPLIGKLDIQDGRLECEVIVPGTTERSMIVVADPEKIMIEHEVDDAHIEKFKFFLIAKNAEFTNFTCAKENGMLLVTAEIVNNERETAKTWTL